MIEQHTEETIVRLELKYCERCGGLLLRRSGAPVVYCGSCANALREMPASGTCVSGRREGSPKQGGSSRGGDAVPVMCDTAPELETVPKKAPHTVTIEASEERRRG